MQLVQALTLPGVPSTSARTRWTFGSHRRLFRLCENVTDLPNHGFLPQISHTADTVRRGYQRGYDEPTMFSRWRCRTVSGIGPA